MMFRGSETAVKSADDQVGRKTEGQMITPTNIGSLHRTYSGETGKKAGGLVGGKILKMSGRKRGEERCPQGVLGRKKLGSRGGFFTSFEHPTMCRGSRDE